MSPFRNDELSLLRAEVESLRRENEALRKENAAIHQKLKNTFEMPAMPDMSKIMNDALKEVDDAFKGTVVKTTIRVTRK